MTSYPPTVVVNEHGKIEISSSRIRGLEKQLMWNKGCSTPILPTSFREDAAALALEMIEALDRRQLAEVALLKSMEHLA